MIKLPVLLAGTERELLKLENAVSVKDTAFSLYWQDRQESPPHYIP